MQRIALLPEIAFARVGSSDQPQDCYDWAKEPDDSPGGSGKTVLERKPTLRITPAGEISEAHPASMVRPQARQIRTRLKIELPQPSQPALEFTEPTDNGRGQRFRPVCPWFVVFAKWSNSDEWQVLTPQDLKSIGASATDLSWHIVVANRKAYNMTLKFEDIVYAETDIGGNEYEVYRSRQPALIEKKLIGKSSKDYWQAHSEFRGQHIAFDHAKRLVLEDHGELRLGTIQAPAFSDQYGIRLRVIPPSGAVYAPTTLKERIEELSGQMTPDDKAVAFDDWLKLDILKDGSRERYCILNPESAWARKVTQPDQEIRTEPGPQFAHIPITRDDGQQVLHSLGLIDDFCDGVITVSLKMPDGAAYAAKARVVVGPPDLAPDRRHPVRFFETFEDRKFLEGDKNYDGQPANLSDDALRAEVLEMFRRAFETVGLTNVDAMNHRWASDSQYGSGFTQGIPSAAPGDLPLTQWAREHHRRLASLETLEDFLREQPHRTGVREVILDPGDENDAKGLINLPPGDSGEVPATNAFSRMPALMRGSQVDALHLTKRQIEVLRRLIKSLG